MAIHFEPDPPARDSDALWNEAAAHEANYQAVAPSLSSIRLIVAAIGAFWFGIAIGLVYHAIRS